LFLLKTFKALSGLLCAVVPWRNYSLTLSLTGGVHYSYSTLVGICCGRSQVAPVLVTRSLLERMRNNFMVIEVWDKKTAAQNDQVSSDANVFLFCFIRLFDTHHSLPTVCHSVWHLSILLMLHDMLSVFSFSLHSCFYSKRSWQWMAFCVLICHLETTQSLTHLSITEHIFMHNILISLSQY